MNESRPVLTFPRRFRITRREGFSQIFERRALVTPWFAVHGKPNTAGHARLGISVSKRIVAGAAQRNAAKRLIRECFRTHSRQGVAVDVVIRLRRPLSDKSLREAKSVLGNLLETILAAK